MKKIFIQFGKWIVKNRKRLIYGAFALLIGQICFFGLNGIGVENQVFAAESTETPTQSDSQIKQATKRNDTLSFCLKLIYALLYPLLAIAGKLVDNSFVYGEIFGFDAVLWNLWNIIKNLANFALGFFLVYKIFEYMIRGDKTVDVKKILISALIAGVGIQASWFLMAALIDVSTILTYGVGGLPISVLGESSDGSSNDSNKIKLEDQNPVILKTVVYLDVNDLKTFAVYLTNVKTGGQYGDVYISECETVKYGTEELILAPKMVYYADGNIIKGTEKDRCHIYGMVHIFNDLYPGIDFRTCSNLDDCKTAQTNYSNSIASAKTKIGNGGDGVDSQIGTTLLRIGMTGENAGLDSFNEKTSEKWTSMKLEDILNGESYVGVFTALYSSLINTVGLMPKNTTLFGEVLGVALSLGHMIAIAIPLLVVSVVFMMRIGILRMAIVLSPFIVLISAFNLWESKLLSGLKGTMEYFKPGNLIVIIFSPAIICFAVSMSAVLVTIINGINAEEVLTSSDDILGGLVKVDIAGIFVPIGKMIIAILGIAITWFLVWAAVESSKLGKSGIAQSLKNLATSALGAIPIVPIPTKDGIKSVGLGALTDKGGIIPNIAGQIRNKYSGNGQEALEQFVNGKEAKANAVKDRDTAYKNGLIAMTAAQLGQDWTKATIMIGEDKNNQIGMQFMDVSDNASKKEIIAAINAIEDENKRAAFGKTPTVKIGEEEYKFVTTMTDKEGKPVTINKYLTNAEKDKLAKDNNYTI